MTSFSSLSLDTIRSAAPSVFTTEGFHTTSDKYKPIPTINIVEGLIAKGFMPVRVSQSSSRIEGKELFVKHMLRFRHVDAQPNHKGLYPEVCLINSHDGTHAYKLVAGVYRLICSNGLIGWAESCQVRVKHIGDETYNRVIEGSFEVMRHGEQLLLSADSMGEIQLDDREALILAETAHSLKFEEDSLQGRAIKPSQLLTPRRYADQPKDLFTTFNVIQENLMKGGLSGGARDANNRYKRTTTRQVNSIDSNVKLNQALWKMADRMAELKSGNVSLVA